MARALVDETHPNWPFAVKIAKRLTPAQRRALTDLPGDGNPRLFADIRGSTVTVLMRMRLIARWRVSASVEDARRYGHSQAWRANGPDTVHEALSLTMEYPHPAASVKGGLSGQIVRAVIEGAAP